MSYINLQVTHSYPAAPWSPAPRETSVDLGYSREGAKLERLTATRTTGGIASSRDALGDPAALEAARGVHQALQGANWVQELTVNHRSSPATASWTTRSGSTGSAPLGQLPEAVQRVLTAADELLALTV